MKKTFAFILSIMTAAAMVGCSVSDKVKEEAQDKIQDAVSKASDKVSEGMDKVSEKLETVDTEKIKEQFAEAEERAREAIEKAIQKVYDHAWVQSDDEKGFVINIVQDEFSSTLKDKKASGETTKTYAPWAANIEGMQSIMQNIKKLTDGMGLTDKNITIITWTSRDHGDKLLEIKNGEVVYDYLAG